MKGDEIVAINGRRVSQLGLDGVRQLFRVPATYRLEVKRQAATLIVEMRTRRLV